MARGRHIQADYTKPPIPQFLGNPCIEALWHEFDLVSVAQALRREPPPMPDAVRTGSENTRLQWLTATLSELFIPSTISLQLAERLWDATILSYQFRNPIFPHTWCPNTLINGFNLPGVSGMGKTTTIIKGLQQMPQRISHRFFNEKRWTKEQLVWIHLDAPSKGSPGTFCDDFFKEVDDILGTTYVKLYGKDTRASLDSMISGMKRIMEINCVGLLFVDEINHLVRRNTEESATLLNFLFSLKNKLGVSVVMLGDYTALPLFTKQLRLMGRASGQGDLVWDRMLPDGPTWTELLPVLFKYQVMPHPVELDQELSSALYYGSQGVLRAALQLFSLAQRYALEKGWDRITPRVIYQTIDRDLLFSGGVLRALRTGDRRLLARHHPDVFPGVLTDYLIEAMRRGDIEGCLHLLPDLQVAARQASQSESAGVQDQAFSDEPPKKKTSTRGSNPKSTQKVPAAETRPLPAPDSILGCVHELPRDHKGRFFAQAVHQKLKDDGFIVNLKNFLVPSQEFKASEVLVH
ncbi:MAG: ATP-binding protein [Nitrospiraceae bacterium]